MRRLLFVAAVLCTWLFASSAMAFVVPLSDIDGRLFPAHADQVQVFSVNTSATPTTAASSGAGAGNEWNVDVEVRLRNLREDPITKSFAFAVSEADQDGADIFVNGAAIDTSLRSLGRSPGARVLSKGEYPVADVHLPSMEIVTIRLRTVVRAKSDELGQTVMTLPYRGFRLYNGPISQSMIRLQLHGRPVGFVSSLKGYTLYDEPENLVTWVKVDWEPSQDLEMAWLGAWRALLLVAEVEECPGPVQVVRSVISGEMKEVDEYLAGFDRETLRFCNALPLVTHGFRFQSRDVREGLSQLSVNRYVGGGMERGPVYRENAHFERDDLSEPEKIYHVTLKARVEE